MLLWISWFISGLITAYFVCINYSVINFNEKYKIKKIDFLVLLVYSSVNTFVIVSGFKSIRLLINFLTAFLSLLLIFRQKTSKTIISTFFIYLIFSISEMIYAFLCMLFLNEIPSTINTTPVRILVTNIFIAILSVFIFKIPFIKKLIKNVIEWYSNK